MLKPYLKKHRLLLNDVMDSLRYFDKRLCTSLGANLYKMRVASAGHSKGKSASFRMVIYVLEVAGVLAPVAFYSKHDRASMSKQELISCASIVIDEFNQLSRSQ